MEECRWVWVWGWTHIEEFGGVWLAGQLLAGFDSVLEREGGHVDGLFAGLDDLGWVVGGCRGIGGGVLLFMYADLCRHVQGCVEGGARPNEYWCSLLERPTTQQLMSAHGGVA